MTIEEYLIKAAGVWFTGFFPLAEIYVAIPTAIAVGLDSVSVVFWAVFGNFTPIVLIVAFYERLLHYERPRQWLNRFSSERFKRQIDRYGTWFVLLITPWAGVWVMAVTAKALHMDSRRLLLFAFISVTIYAIGITLLINAGVATFS